MELKPCKVCGSIPILVQARGDLYFNEYICPKAWSGDCKSSEEELLKKALKNWNDKQ